MEQPFFTVIIPTYNRLTYLHEAIESVLAQECDDWELIVVDDGSHPPARPLVLEFKDPRVRYFYQPNQGLGAARQRGVELATGKYLCYLDDDDCLLPSHLNSIATAYHEQNQREQLYKTGMISLTADAASVPGKLFNNHQPALPQHWRHAVGIFPYAIPRRLALEVPSINYYLTEDFNWVGRLMLQLPVHQVDTYTVVCRQHDRNRSSILMDDRALAARIAAVQDLYAQPGMAEVVPRRLYKNVLAHQYWHWVRQRLRKGLYRKALSTLVTSLRYLTITNGRELLYTLYLFLRTLRR